MITVYNKDYFLPCLIIVYLLIRMTSQKYDPLKMHMDLPPSTRRQLTHKIAVS